MHTALVRRLLRDRSAWKLVQFPAPCLEPTPRRAAASLHAAQA
jgi:hypothetical protein